MIYIYKFFFFFFKRLTRPFRHTFENVLPDRVYDPVIYTLDILLWKMETN